jgi:hypothetical protein
MQVIYLTHLWRDSTYPFYWRKTGSFLQIDNVYDLFGVNGNPSLIQSTFGQRSTDFHLVVPLTKGGIYHIGKNNDGPDPGRNPWKIANDGIPLDQGTKYQAVSYRVIITDQHIGVIWN